MYRMTLYGARLNTGNYTPAKTFSNYVSSRTKTKFSRQVGCLDFFCSYRKDHMKTSLYDSTK